MAKKITKQVVASTSTEPALVVGANPALLPWPTDQWGLTKDLKQAITQLGSRIAGHEDKKELVDATLAVALAFLEAKYEQDAEIRAARIAEAAAEAEASE